MAEPTTAPAAPAQRAGCVRTLRVAALAAAAINAAVVRLNGPC